MGEIRGNGGESYVVDIIQFWRIRCDGNQIFLFSNQPDTKYLQSIMTYRRTLFFFFFFFFFPLPVVMGGKNKEMFFAVGNKSEI